MESFGAARKRGRPDAANGNGGFAAAKRTKGKDLLGFLLVRVIWDGETLVLCHADDY